MPGARVATPRDRGGDALVSDDGRTVAALVIPPPGRPVPGENPEALAAARRASERIEVATGLAAGILLDATVVRALVVPALVTLLGPANWWLPGRRSGARSPVR